MTTRYGMTYVMLFAWLLYTWFATLHPGQTVFYYFYTNGGDCAEICIGRITSDILYPPGYQSQATRLLVTYEIPGENLSRPIGSGEIVLSQGGTYFPEIQELPRLAYIYDGFTSIYSNMGNKFRQWRVLLPGMLK